MAKKYEDLPTEVRHPTDRAHTLKLVKSTGSGAAFECDGCKEPGDGPRYTGGSGTSTICLHPDCARADAAIPLQHHLFDGREFRFLPEPTPPVDKTICDACGDHARGFVYHSSASKKEEEELDLHPCCANLPRTMNLQLDQGRYTFELCRGASGRCASCRKSRKFWAYRWRNVNLHVACVRKAASQAWDEDFHNRNGSGGGVVQASAPAMEAAVRRKLAENAQNNGFDNMLNLVDNVGKVIVAVILGNPFAMIDAVLGAGGFLQR